MPSDPFDQNHLYLRLSSSVLLIPVVSLCRFAAIDHSSNSATEPSLIAHSLSVLLCQKAANTADLKTNIAL